MKRKLSIILILTMLAAILLPLSGFALSSTDMSAVKVQNEYFFEDFSKFTGPESINMYAEGLGYYSNDGGHEVSQDTSNGTMAVRWSQYEKDGIINGPRGDNRPTGDWQHSEPFKYNEHSFNITKASFEDAGKAIVFSFDVFIPYMEAGGSQSIYSNLAYGDAAGNNTYMTWFAKGAQVSVTNAEGQFFGTYYDKVSTVYNKGPYLNSAKSYRATSGIPKEGKWCNMQTVVKYDPENMDYISWNYIDGKPLLDENGEVAKLIFDPDDRTLTDIQNRASINFDIRIRCDAATNEDRDKDVILDNVCIRLYDGSTMDSFMQVPANNTEFDIDLYNGYNFSGDDSDIPSQVKSAALVNKELTQDDVVIECFEPEDKLLLNGTVIDERESVIDGSAIAVSNIPERADGYNLRVTLGNIESVDEGELRNTSMFISSDENFKGVMNSSFKDIGGREVSVSSADSVPTKVNKMELALRGVDYATITDGTNEYTARGGVFDFTQKPLAPGTTYTLKLDGEDYTTFTTADAGELTFSNIGVSSNTASVKYMNTFSEDKEVYFTVMYFDDADRVIKTVMSKKTAEKNKADTLAMAVDPQVGAAYCKIMILDSLQTAVPLTEMFSGQGEIAEQQPTKLIKDFDISPFDNSGTAAVKGRLTANEGQRVTVSLLDSEGNLAYANDFSSAADGTYTFNINMPAVALTDTYKLYIAADGNNFVNGKDVHYSADSSAALAIVNGAETAADMYSAINSNRDDLEFYYDEYTDSFTEADELAVSELILNKKNELKKANGVGFITTDKRSAVDVYRKAVIVQAIKLGKVSNYPELTQHFSELSEGVIHDWLDSDGTKDVRDEVRDKWINGILTRLKGASFTTFDEFIDKFRASLVFECIAAPDGYENIKGILTDYVNQKYISGLSKEYITNTVCTKLVKKVYSGFDYTQLVNDIKGYNETTSAGDSGANKYSGGSSSGGGAFVGGATIPEPIVKDNDEVKSDIFRDVEDCWAKDIIVELANKNIISGVGDGYFAPERNITREEFAAIVVRMLNLSAVFETDIPFADVTKDDWCYDAVKIAYQHGIINGKSLNEFGMGENISRQDMAVMLKNVLDVINVEYTESDIDFADMGEIDDYAKKAVGILSGAEIINGYEDSTFRPHGLATRAEAAKVIYEVLKVLNK